MHLSQKQASVTLPFHYCKAYRRE